MKHSGNRSGAGLREVLFEFSAVGNSVRVCAVDPVSGTEVTLIGPVSAGEAALKRTAMRKLEYVLNKQRRERATPRGLRV